MQYASFARTSKMHAFSVVGPPYHVEQPSQRSVCSCNQGLDSAHTFFKHLKIFLAWAYLGKGYELKTPT